LQRLNNDYSRQEHSELQLSSHNVMNADTSMALHLRDSTRWEHIYCGTLVG